jgi:hypothetical protein
MKFEFTLVPSADQDLAYYKVREQKIILNELFIRGQRVEIRSVRLISWSFDPSIVILRRYNCG